MVKEAKKETESVKVKAEEVEQAHIEQTTKKEKKMKKPKIKKGDTHEDFLTLSFVIRSVLALLIYVSVFFSEWANNVIWGPLLQTIYRALNIDAFFWRISNQNQVAHSAYVGMYVENMLYLILFITIVPLFLPEIKNGLRKLKHNAWTLSLLPVIHFCMFIFTIIVIIVVNSFVSLPDSSVNQDMINESMKVSPWGSVFPTLIAAPFVEEIIFRVIIGGGTFMLLTTLFNRNHTKQKKIIFSAIGIIVSVVLFGLLHVTSGDILAIFPYLVMGLGMSLTYFVSGRNVIMSILLHMYQNIFATLAQLLFPKR